MREYATVLEVDERGRTSIPPPMRKALGIENKRAIVMAVLSVIKEENENPHEVLVPALA